MTSLLSFSKAKQGGLKDWVTDSRSYRGCSQFTLTTSRRNADWLQEKEPARGGDEKSQVPRHWNALFKRQLIKPFIWIKKNSKPSIYLKTSWRLRRHSDCLSHIVPRLLIQAASAISKGRKVRPLKCLQVVWKPFQREAQRTSLPSTFLEIKDLCIIYTTSKGSTSKQWPINQ